MGILKTLLIILLVYYGFKILARIFAPMIVTYAARKTEAHFREQFGKGPGQQQDFKNKNLHKQDSGKSRENDKIGEYIEFEEIE